MFTLALRYACVVVFLVAVPSIVCGHGSVHERIASVSEEIAKDPDNAGLYLKRAELHRDHRDWDAALADYGKAGQLDPALKAIDFYRGRVLFEAGSSEAARRALDRFLVRYPQHPEARLIRARALSALGNHPAAETDYSSAIKGFAEPSPDLYLERAQALMAAGDANTKKALRGLDEGILKLGPIVTLQLYAIELELRKKRWDRALSRLELIAVQSERKEQWLARRGEILTLAGRREPAREAFVSALNALESLPPHARNSKATSELEADVRAALARENRLD